MKFGVASYFFQEIWYSSSLLHEILYNSFHEIWYSVYFVKFGLGSYFFQEIWYSSYLQIY